ncbi:MAG: peptidoglycan-binding protein [Betaproteobacteria bacterium AqS2]|uniref:Peptidoglycan-binding protein n=1 Tax=Candidatus Amphirhobacter heronislandensis TaxID=1732024 RepID=A0A930UG75_9GAMM|nr:peptidoglycan-binding protein [Betaproteobacteria bacterium AqS2]
MVRDAQMLLKDLGYDAGGVDGRLGTKTRAAIRAFQEDEGVAQSGEVDVGLLSRLRQARSRQQ